MFDRRIKDILREILTLKNLKKKSAMVLETVEKSFSVSFNIVLSGINLQSEKIAVVKMSNTGNNPIAQVYFDVQTFDFRQLAVNRVVDVNGDLYFYIYIANDQNQDDWNEIMQGNTVSLSYDCKIVSTADTTLSISYINL